MKKKIILLGCTGTIGKNTIDVIRAMRDCFEIVALSAHTREDLLLSLAKEFNVKNLTLSGKENSNKEIAYHSHEGLLRMIRETDADIVVNGIAGSAGLLSSFASLESKKDLALANKETVVMAGQLIAEAEKKSGKKIIPVDSEHSAIFHLLQKRDPKEIDEIIITASGGAFRDMPAEKLKNVTLEDALKHPNWSMGKKITIDSASLANKGLEVIEAYQLFALPLAKIKVLIHPQSMVHSLIRTNEGSMYAQISKPDMRIPIQNALTYPALGSSIFGRLDLANITLDFKAPDFDKYPMLSLAYKAAEHGQASCIAYNAANEVAVDAFMKKEIRFTDISIITDKTISALTQKIINTIDDVMEADRKSRTIALQFIKELK